MPVVRHLGRIGVFALGLLSAALADKPAQTYTVNIKNFTFVPDHLTVAVGDTVLWKNEDMVPHTASAKDVFDSKEIDSMKTWSYKAERKGTLLYTCTFHPFMHGELTVR